MKRRYYTLDVFTDQPFAGNPLAVVLDSDGLDDDAMQRIAVEFNLSETVFVSPAEKAEKGAAVRIFTPAHELPFAGHPTAGTAILLNHLNHFGVGDDFVLEEKVGPVRCVISQGNVGVTARFGLPRIAEPMDHVFDASGWAKALGLEVSSIDVETAGLWDGGVPYTMVPVGSIETVGDISIDMSFLREVEPIFDGIAANPYVFCEGGVSADADFHARMFAPLFGIPEDPATGSAVASMSGWIAKHKMADTEKRTFKIEQGYEMQRPSQIYLDIEKADGRIMKAGISGSAAIISDGVLHI